MSYGFLALNNNNQILVSSDTRNLHLITKASVPIQTNSSYNYFGGIRSWTYRVTCAVTPVPFFTMPQTTVYLNNLIVKLPTYYGVARISSVNSNTWDIEIISNYTGNYDGTSEYPEVYVFGDPRASTSQETHGLLVYRDDGTASFDSRLRPLAVAGGVSVTHPSNPRPSFPYGLNPQYCGASLADQGGHFSPTSTGNTYTLPSALGQITKPMFCFMSLAQAERRAVYTATEEECDGVELFGNCIGAKRIYTWRSTYWAFYRGGISYTSDITQFNVTANWIVVYFGCRYTYDRASGIIGIGTGNYDTQGGTWPYSNETINLTSNTVIIADASRYD